MYKNYEDKWNALEELVIKLFMPTVNKDFHYIKLYVNPTFTNKFVLQFQLLKNQIIWCRTTWLSETDRPIVYESTLESELPNPTLRIEKGELEKEKFNSLYNLITKLTIPPFIDEDWGDYKDGGIYTLTIGYKSCITTYTWHYLPEKWSELQHLANTLLNLSNDVPSKKL